MIQLQLDISLPVTKNIDNFIWSQNNKLVQKSLDEWLAWQPNMPAVHRYILLYGETNCGASHLAKAIAWQQIQQTNSKVYYIDLKAPNSITNMLLADKPIAIVIDHIDVAVASLAMQKDLFHLFNHWHNSGVKILVTAKKNANNYQFALPDLQTRLEQFLQMKLEVLGDVELHSALVLYAQSKGWLHCEFGIDFLIAKYQGEINKIFSLVDKVIDNFPVNKNSSNSALKNYLQAL